MTAKQLRQRRLLLMQDEANIHARLQELEEERARLERALERTTGARLECDHWLNDLANKEEGNTYESEDPEI